MSEWGLNNHRYSHEQQQKPLLPGAASHGTGYDIEGVLRNVIRDDSERLKREMESQYHFNPYLNGISEHELVQGPKKTPIPPHLTPQQQSQIGQMVDMINSKAKLDTHSHHQLGADYVQYLKKYQQRHKDSTMISPADQILGRERPAYADEKITITY